MNIDNIDATKRETALTNALVECQDTRAALEFDNRRKAARIEDLEHRVEALTLEVTERRNRIAQLEKDVSEYELVLELINTASDPDASVKVKDGGEDE